MAILRDLLSTQPAQAQQQAPAPQLPGGMSMQSGQLGVAGPTGPGAGTGLSILPGDQPPLGLPQQAGWMSWGIPLLNAAGAALSTPSAGGAGPIMGNALMAGTGTYQQMQQLKAQQELARQKAQQQQAYQQLRIAMSQQGLEERQRHDVETERRMSEPRPESEASVALKKAQTERALRPPTTTGRPQEQVNFDKANAEMNKFIRALRADPMYKDLTDEQLLSLPNVTFQAQRLGTQYGVPPERLLGIQLVPGPAEGAQPAHKISDDDLKKFLEGF